MAFQDGARSFRKRRYAENLSLLAKELTVFD